MITMFCGVPGSGKSTGLAWAARRATRRPGRPIYLCGQKISDPHKTVYTNFPFPGCYQLDFDTLGKCEYSDCLLIIDEAMMYMDSRDFKNFSEYLKYFFSQHRKTNVDIILASQSYDDTDKKVRNLTVNIMHFVQLPFSLFKVTAIEPFFNITNFKIASGYDWGRSQFIYGKPLFKLFDSYRTISNSGELPLPPKILWESDTDTDSTTPDSDPDSVTTTDGTPAAKTTKLTRLSKTEPDDLKK